jgi:energy-converting hydrogenase Eha subunit A
MLSVAVAVMCVAVGIGLWLGAQHLIVEVPSSKARQAAIAHGILAAACVALTYVALARPGPPVIGFGWAAWCVLAATLAGGLTILTLNLFRRRPAKPLIAAHAMAGLTGAVMLAAYFSTRGSFGR